MWSGFGGHSEEEDGGDPVTTWRREMREELGIALAPEQIVPLREGINPYTGRRRYIFYVLWPALNEDFVLTEGDGFAWFTLMDALALPDVQPLAHADLAILHAAASRTE
jgi:8-oxo-dGTP pyrophosphatase MutT (NUDIX family)